MKRMWEAINSFIIRERATVHRVETSGAYWVTMHSTAQSPLAVIFRAQENKVCHCFSCFPIYLPWSDGTGWSLFFECWVLSQLFHSTSSPSSRSSFVPPCFLPLKWYHLLVPCEVDRIIWCCWYFSSVILIPACNTSNMAFCMMYSEYKLNKPSDNIQSFHIPCHITCFNEWQNKFKKTWNPLISLFRDKSYCSANFILSYENHFNRSFCP